MFGKTEKKSHRVSVTLWDRFVLGQRSDVPFEIEVDFSHVR